MVNSALKKINYMPDHYRLIVKFKPKGPGNAFFGSIKDLLAAVPGVRWINDSDGNYNEPGGDASLEFLIKQHPQNRSSGYSRVILKTVNPAESIEKLLQFAFNIALFTDGDVYDPQLSLNVDEDNYEAVQEHAVQGPDRDSNRDIPWAKPNATTKKKDSPAKTAFWIVLFIIFAILRGCL